MSSFDSATLAHLAQAGLVAPMARSYGHPRVAIGVIDGAIDVAHPMLSAPVRMLGGGPRRPSTHGTFVAGVLGARRGEGAPAICPASPLVSVPLFDNDASSATLRDVADAIRACLDARVSVINLSVEATVGRADPTPLVDALDLAAAREIAIVVAAGNTSALEASPLTAHPWVIPVVAGDDAGMPLATATLARGIGERGLVAPGRNVTSLGVGGTLARMSGASVAAPFVTGAFALLRAMNPHVSARALVRALRGPERRRALVPPRMNVAAVERRL